MLFGKYVQKTSVLRPPGAVNPRGTALLILATQKGEERFQGAQSVDKVNRLPDAEKPCKARKRGLQMRAHT